MSGIKGYIDACKHTKEQTIQLYHAALRPVIIIGAVLFYFAYYLRGNMLGAERALEWAKPLVLIMVLHGFILDNALFEKKTTGCRILMLSAAWMILSRCRLGNYTFQVLDVGLFTVLMWLVYVSGTCLDEKNRQRIVSLVALELAAVTAVWGTLSVQTALSAHSLEGHEGIHIVYSASAAAAHYIETYVNRNIGSMYFVITAGMLMYQAVKTRKILWRVVAVLYSPLAFVSVSLQRGAAASVCLSLLMSVSTAIVLKGIFWPSHMKVGRAAAVLCGCLICTALIFESLGVCANVLFERGQQNRIREWEEAQAAQEAEEVSVAGMARGLISAENTIVLYQKYKYIPHTMTIYPGKVALVALGGVASANQNAESPEPVWVSKSNSFGQRMDIWKAAIQVVMSNRRTLIWGSPAVNAMEPINALLRFDYKHTHNMLIQQLVIAGVPGLILYSLFLATILYNSVVGLQSSREKRLSLGILATLVATIILDGMVEPLMTSQTAVSSLLFVFLAGVQAAETRKLQS